MGVPNRTPIINYNVMQLRKLINTITIICHCAKLFINHDVKIVINSIAANSVNKIPVLLTKTLCLQGFFYVLRVKKDLAELLLQGLNLIFNFALWLINGFTH